METSVQAAAYAESTSTFTPQRIIPQVSPQQISHMASFRKHPRALREDDSPYTKPSRAQRKARNRAKK